MKQTKNIRETLSTKGLKVTPQRISVLEAIYQLKNHPTADNIREFVHKKYPNIGTGTVYKVLETLVENQIIKKVKTVKDVMRYDGITENHHHIYCIECDYIEDYVNEKLDAMLKQFFEENKIENFVIDDITVNINGNFVIHKNQNH